MLATEYASYYKFEGQGENETEEDFRRRIALELRKKELLIEAHEALQDGRYESNDAVMDGIFGAIAQALSDTHYGGNPLDNDVVAGKLVRHQLSEKGQQEKETRELMAKMLMAGLSPDDLRNLGGNNR